MSVMRTAIDLAKHLGLSRKTVYSHIKNGLLPPPMRTSQGAKVGWTDEYLAQYQKKLMSSAIKKVDDMSRKESK